MRLGKIIASELKSYRKLYRTMESYTVLKCIFLLFTRTLGICEGIAVVLWELDLTEVGI